MTLVGALIVPAIPMAVPRASAATLGSLVTRMEIDGNKANGAAPGFDWNDIQDGTLPGGYVINATTTSAGVVAQAYQIDSPTNDINNSCGVADANVFGGGAKIDQNPWNIVPAGSSGPNDKNDLCSGGAAIEVVNVNGQVHYVLYEYYTRTPDSSGDQSVLIHLAGPAVGRCDDKLLNYNYNPSGGGTVTVTPMTWSPSPANDCSALGQGVWVAGTPITTLQAATGPNPELPDTLTSKSFGELAIDLTASGFLPETACTTYSVGNIITYTGNDPNSGLKDILGFANPLTFSTCASVSVSKVANPPEAAVGVNFGYQLDQLDAKATHDATLSGTGGGADTDGSPLSITSEIQGGQTHVWSNVIAEPDYRLAESTPLPAGWTLDNITCTFWDPFFVVGGNVVPQLRTVTWSTNPASPFVIPSPITKPAGQPNTSCTITNKVSGIRIVKNALPDGPQDFSFTATGAGLPGNFLLDDDADVTLPNARFFAAAAGTYTVTEAATSGWDLTGLSCDDQTGTTTTVGATATIDLAAGELVTCTFTNTKRGSIAIVKDAVPGTDATAFDYSASGGLAPASFTLTDNGVAGANTQSFPDLVPGTYAVTELAETGWTLGGIVCSDPNGDTSTNGATATIDLDAGENITCTYTNDLNTAEITLTKAWSAGPLGDAVSLSATGSSGQFPAANGSSSNDGLANDADAVLTVRGAETVTLGEAFTAGDAANYTTTLSCTDASGLSYVPGAATGTYTVPAEPVDVTCTFTNTRKSAQLRLQKGWETPVAGDQTDLTIDATTDATINGVTAPTAGFVETTVYAGETAQLAEVLAAGNAAAYTAHLDCDAPGLTYNPGDLAGSYAVASSPVDVTCTFTNTRRSTTLVLTKSWVQGIAGDTVTVTAGGGVSPDVSTSSTANTAATTSALTVYSAETIDLAEVFTAPADPAVYTTVLSCTAGTLTWTTGALSGSVQIPKTPAGQISCTFTNARKTALVQVQKSLSDPLTPSATFDLSINGNLAVDDATDGSQSAPVAVLVGDTVTVAEDGDPAFTSLLACDSGVTVNDNFGTSGEFVVPVSAYNAAPIICTFTNARRSATLTVQKVWVNGAQGDQSSLSADIAAGTDPAPATSTASGAAGSETDAANVVTTTVYAGEAVGIAEALAGGNIGSYGSTLACTGAGGLDPAGDGRSGTYTMPAAAADVTCTFTNTRLSNTVVVQKRWVDGLAGDTATIDASGANGLQSATSTATGAADETDAAHAVTLTALTGETVTLGELLSNADRYDAVLTCDAGSLAPASPTTSGVLTVPSAAGGTTTCTFTNTRKTATVDVTKVLTDPVGDSSFDLTINGTPGLTGTTGGVVSPTRSVLVGDAVNVAETANTGSLDNFTSTLACALDDGTSVSMTSNSGIAGTFTVPSAANTSSPIHCTFTNVRKSVDLTLDKAWVTPVNGDIATLTVDPTARPAISNADSVAPGTTPVTIPVYAGEAVSLQEALPAPNVGGYAPGLSCTQPGLSYTPGVLSGTYTVPSNPQGVTCTFTNTRTTATISLAKAWANAKSDDVVDLTIGSPTGGPAQATSTAPTANETAEITVLTGETVDLAEAFTVGDPANYVTSLACTGATNSPSYTPDALTGTLAVAKADADGDIVCEFTNGRGTAEVVVAKALIDPLTPQASFDLSINGNVVVAGAQDGDSNAANPVTVNLGDTVGVSEEINVSFGSTLTCVEQDGTPVTVNPNAGTSGSFVAPASAADQIITCTFENSRTSAPLNLQKVWVDGATGDAADLSIDGVNDGSATSTAPDAPGTTNTATIDVYAGETVQLDENLGAGNTGAYTTSLVCDNQAITLSADLTGSFTMPAVPDDVTCTFTNTRTRADLSLQKVWVNGNPGDSADLTIGADLGGDAASSTAPDAPGAGNTATATVLSGEVVDLGEVLAGTGGYDTVLDCTDAAGLTYSTGARNGTYTVPADPADVVCTFTNTRRSATLTLTKAWADARTGEQVTLNATGSSGIAAPADGSSTAPSATTPATLTIYSGETVTLDEAFGIPANAANYTTTLECGGVPVADFDALALDGTYAVATSPVDVTCSFTNTRKAASLTLQKVWVDGAAGDTAALEIAGDAGSSAPATSTAPDAPAPANQATLTVYAGETVDLGETLAGTNVGSYDTTLACGLQQIATTTSGSYTVPADPQPVTCTFTNTRQRSTLTLHKTWVDAAAGDSALLTLTGTQGSPTDTSVATGGIGTQDDTGNTVTLTVLSGEVATLTESITGVGIYGTTLTCTGPGTLSYAGGQTGTVTAPKQSGVQTDCVFTNTAGRGTIIIDKHVAGADRTFTFDGTWAGGAAFDIATTGGSGQQQFGGVLAGSYTVGEILPAGYVLTALTCVETSPAPDQGDTTGVNGTTGLIDLDAGESVLCTFTNAQRGPLEVTKTVTSGPTLVSGTTYRVTYDVEVTSASYIDETFDLSDTLNFGGGFSVVSATSSPAVPGWTGVAPNTALVTGGTIAALGTITYTITVDADVAGSTAAADRDCVQDDGEGTGFLNTTVVAWDGGTDADEACASLPPEADVAVVKTADPEFVTINQDEAAPQVGWSIVVTNNGPVEAVGVTLDDNVPATFIGVTATTPTGSCGVIGQAVHCDLGTMAFGASITVTVTAIVAAGTQAGTYTNVALVGSASPPDPNLGNNSDSAATDVAVVAVQPPPPPPTTTAPTVPPTAAPEPPVPSTLPVTGGNTVGIQYLAALALGLGLGAVVITRRRRHRSA